MSSDRYLTCNEAAEFLGCSPSTVRRLCRDRRLQFMQNAPGGSLRFRSAWLEDFAGRQTVRPAALNVEVIDSRKRSAVDVPAAGSYAEFLAQL